MDKTITEVSWLSAAGSFKNKRYAVLVAFTFMVSLFNPRRNLFARFFYTAVLVFGTYNPSGFSAAHMVSASVTKDLILLWWPVLLVVVFAFGFVCWKFIQALYIALGAARLVVLAFLLGGFVYLPLHYIMVDVSDVSIVWVGQSILTLLIWYGTIHVNVQFRLFGHKQFVVTGEVN